MRGQRIAEATGSPAHHQQVAQPGIAVATSLQGGSQQPHHLRVVGQPALRYEGLLRLLATSGLRFGEMVGLEVARTDVLRRRLDVAEAATQVGGVLTTGTSRRR